MTCGVRSPKRLPAVLLGAALALLCESRSLAAQAQATTGLIRGVVSDPSGSPVAGARVTVTDVQTRFQHTVVTNEKGVFVAPLLPLGTYEVTARAVGLGERKQTDIILRVGETVDLALKLEPVELAAVTVTATPLVDVTKVETSTRLPNQAVSGLPNNGRNYLNLTLLTPNVSIVQGPDGDELTVAGQKGIHNNVSVDGADFNNPFFGEQRGGQRPPFTFNLDAVQEIVVTAGGATPEFGRSGSGFIHVITKSGTNQLRGSVHYFGKFDAISGTSPARTTPAPASSSSTGGPPTSTTSRSSTTTPGPSRRTGRSTSTCGPGARTAWRRTTRTPSTAAWSPTCRRIRRTSSGSNIPARIGPGRTWGRARRRWVPTRPRRGSGPSRMWRWTSRTDFASGCRSSCRSSTTTPGSSCSTTSPTRAATTSSRRGPSGTG